MFLQKLYSRYTIVFKFPELSRAAGY